VRVRLRPATQADLDAIIAIVDEGFEGYREFAPASYQPPSRGEHREWLGAALERDELWFEVAEADGCVVGHCAFLPATASRWGSDDPKLAHFAQLFVLRSSWGSGAASTLHAAALDEMVARGFERARLFTPTGALRARRFYEREGWAPSGLEAADAGPLRIAVSEYRRELPARRR
jgi:GNAT superfamily N-acetyltransferase